MAASRGREQLTVITSDKAQLEESMAQSSARLSASELVRTSHVRATGLTPDATRGFERGIHAVVEGVRQSREIERDAPEHALPGPARQQQQSMAQAVSQGRAAHELQIRRGGGLGIGF